MSSQRDDDDSMELDHAPVELSDDGDQDDFEHFDDDYEIEVDDGIPESEDDSDGSVQKDDTEEELERLVFGDTAGFKQDIKTWKASGEEEVAATDRSLAAIGNDEVWL